MTRDMAGVLVGGAHDRVQKQRVEDDTAPAQDVECKQPVGDADAHVHRAGPVDAEARRIGGQEIEDLVPYFARINIRRREVRPSRP